MFCVYGVCINMYSLPQLYISIYNVIPLKRFMFNVFVFGTFTGRPLCIFPSVLNEAATLVQFTRVASTPKTSDPSCVLSKSWGETVSPVILLDGIINYVHFVSTSVQYSLVGLELCPARPASIPSVASLCATAAFQFQ